MRNPDEKPLVSQESSAKPSAVETVAKANVKKAKEDPISAPIDASVVEKAPKETKNKPQKEAKNSRPTGSGITLEPVELELKGGISGSEKLQEDPQPKRIEVVDEAKLKEMRREEEIAKAKLAVERKKKLAQKAAAKAAIKAQKEAEKKLKDREKKAKKKVAASAPASELEDQPTEVDNEVIKPENVEAPVPSKNKDRKEIPIRYRNRAKGPNSLPGAILKQKKSTDYWVWAAPAAAAALSVLLVIVIGYKYFI